MDTRDILNPLALINEETNIAKFTQSALGYAQPMVLPFRNIVVVTGPDKGRNLTTDSISVLDKAADKGTDPVVEAKSRHALSMLGETFFQCPVSFNIAGGMWTLPIDPLISVSNKNVIKRRYVSKSGMRGSIKECWSQDDCEVTIAGVIIGTDGGDCADKVSKLREICEKAEAVEIVCEYLNTTFGISRIAVESCDFPFTKGMENQSFTIKAYSDDGYELLEEV